MTIPDLCFYQTFKLVLYPFLWERGEMSRKRELIKNRKCLSNKWPEIKILKLENQKKDTNFVCLKKNPLIHPEKDGLSRFHCNRSY